MRFHSIVFGLAFAATLAPMAAFAQDLIQGGASPDRTYTAPDNDTLGGNANPFTGAAGADRYIRDNTTAGFSWPNNGGTSNSSSLNNFIGGDPDDSDSNNGN